MSESSRRSRYLWMLSLAAALVFLVVDSAVRLRGIDALTRTTIGSPRPLTLDPAAPSGYQGNQHNLIFPSDGTDGYHWTMQTQQMLAQGSGRVRWVDYDGPPGGRAVHWSSLLHWWTAMFAWSYSTIRGIPIGLAVERVSPWVNTAFLALLLIVLVPVVARRFGALPASLLAVGAVTVAPAYSLYAVGNFDHHGLASAAAMLCVLFLLGGGAGWVRTDGTDAAQARRWFIASGIAGGAGLWISAATQIPALFCIGFAALVSTGILARSGGGAGATGATIDSRTAAWRTDPRLWRMWGMAGGASSFFFFLLEYFPSHMGMRLEVNHPLYALAWIGAGDLLFRLSVLLEGGREPHARAAPWLALDVMLIGAVPAIMWLVPESFVLRPGSLIMALHQDYIEEFHGLARQLAHWPLAQIVTEAGVLPLVLMGPAVTLALKKSIAKPLRALAVVGLVPALGYTLLACWQTRWIGIAYVQWLCTLVAVATVTLATVSRWTSARIAASGLCLGLAFAPFPVLSLHKWTVAHGVYPSSPDDFTEVVARDVSQKLRARLGADRGVIAGGPTTTTWMVYFGGFRGVGTLYWENRDGITAAARLFGATAPASGGLASDSAYTLVKQLGVTHLVLYSWNAFTAEYARLALGLRVPAVPTAADEDATSRAFGQQLLQGSFPAWLRPVAYQVPPITGYESPWALVLEVVPDQTLTEAATRFGQYWLAMGQEESAMRQLDIALKMDPGYVPALIGLTRVQLGNAGRGDFHATMQRIRAARSVNSLAFEDNVSLALLYMRMGDTAAARPVVMRAVEQADERSIRRLPWDHTTANFVVLARQFGVASRRPEIVDFAFSLLDSASKERITPAPR